MLAAPRCVYGGRLFWVSGVRVNVASLSRPVPASEDQSFRQIFAVLLELHVNGIRVTQDPRLVLWVSNPDVARTASLLPFELGGVFPCSRRGEDCLCPTDDSFFLKTKIGAFRWWP